MKNVYVALIADLLHAGHINVIKEAALLGEVTIGLLTLEACAELDDIPYLDYEKREEVLCSLSFVKKVIPQETASYKANLEMLKPDYVVHGDDWRVGPQCKLREEVLDLLGGYGGELVEVAYSEDINALDVKERMTSLGITSGARLGRLKRLVASKKLVTILEVHNALSGLIVEKTAIEIEGLNTASFDGMWSSSLTDSTSKGKPDIEAVDATARLAMVNEIFEVTTKPMIYDADTGGKVEHFEFLVRNLERVGVSAVVIEDKIGLKKNSMLGTGARQTQDSTQNFCDKIRAGKAAQITRDFMIVARVESLVLGAGVDDALARASEYVQAGADGIMIHSCMKEPTEVFEFVDLFREKDPLTPLVVVPTSFNSVTLNEFRGRGVNIVIYANHLLRAAYPAMKNVAESILKNQRALEAESNCMPIKDVLRLIPGNS